jgi:hypothetical protein
VRHAGGLSRRDERISKPGEEEELAWPGLRGREWIR